MISRTNLSVISSNVTNVSGCKEKNKGNPPKQCKNIGIRSLIVNLIEESLGALNEEALSIKQVVL